MKLSQFFLSVFLILALGACTTPGNLKIDTDELNLALANANTHSNLVIEFVFTPGILHIYREGMAGGVFFSSSHSLDADPIAIEMAELVFAKLFDEIYIDPINSDLKNKRFLLRLKAFAEATSLACKHIATVKAALFDQNGTILLETKSINTVLGTTCGAEEPMKRAFLRSYKEIALQIDNILNSRELD